MGTYDDFRTLLNIRQQRKRPRAGLKPAIGAKLVLDDFRMVVLPGLSEDLWQFLVRVGFRESRYAPERRHYRDMPPSLVAALFEGTPNQRQALLMVALTEASKRPRVRMLTRPARSDP